MQNHVLSYCMAFGGIADAKSALFFVAQPIKLVQTNAIIAIKKQYAKHPSFIENKTTRESA